MIENNLLKIKKQEQPKASKTSITSYDILQEIETTKNTFKALKHALVLNELLQRIVKIDFKTLVYPEYPKTLKEYEDIKGNEDEKDKIKELKSKLAKMRLQKKHLIVCSVEEILKLAKQHHWGLSKQYDFIYLYNGAYWSLLNEDELKGFLGKSAEKMGIDKYDSRLYSFREQLQRQFLSTAYLPQPESQDNKVLVNLKNGTFEVTPEGHYLRNFNREDFITYQLPFDFEPTAKAPLFQKYLDKVQPDKERQNLLAEFIGYVFTRHLKLEKTLLLYGTGANGKSVFFEIMNALLGSENVSSYSLSSLTNENGYFRAKLANKLVNYASEINGKLETSIFKQLVSGEPVEARLPYGDPFTLSEYARLIFNCNELPREVEHTNAYFRRFLIIHFGVTIPEEEQDKELSNKIIKGELSGVFNWVLEGLNRLLKQKKFSSSEAVNNQLKDYRLQSDSVHLFLEDEGLIKSINNWYSMKELFINYKTFCMNDNYRPVSKSNFKKRLKSKGILIDRNNTGYVAYLEHRSEG